MATTTSAPHFIRALSTRTSCSEGSTVVLEATVSGRPRPVVSWHKNGSPVLVRAIQDRHATYDSETGRCRLVLGAASEDDEGEYECRAKNILGQVSCFGELYVTRPHPAGRSTAGGHSARTTTTTMTSTRMGSPLTDDSTNDEPEIKSGLFILIDEGSQDEENSDELGHRGSISASEQIESIIEDLTLPDGSLNLSLAKDGSFMSEDGTSIREEQQDDSKDLKMFKSKKLGDYFDDDDDDDRDDDNDNDAGDEDDEDQDSMSNVFADVEYNDFDDPRLRHTIGSSRPNGRTYVRHRSHVESSSASSGCPWSGQRARDCKAAVTAASLHLHKVNAEERLNEVFDYSADCAECPPAVEDDNDLPKVSRTADVVDASQRPAFFDVDIGPASAKIKSDVYADLNFSGLDTWKAGSSSSSSKHQPPPIGARRFTTTDEVAAADKDPGNCLLRGKVVRQRSNSDGKVVPNVADPQTTTVDDDDRVDADKSQLDCPWDSMEKIWHDSPVPNSDSDEVFVQKSSKPASSADDQANSVDSVNDFQRDDRFDGQSKEIISAQEIKKMSNYSSKSSYQSYSYSSRSAASSAGFAAESVSASYSRISSSAGIGNESRERSRVSRSGITAYDESSFDAVESRPSLQAPPPVSPTCYSFIDIF